MLFWPVLIIAVAVVVVFFAGPPADGLFEGARGETRMLYLTVLISAMAIASAGRIVLRGGRKALVTTTIWIGAIAGLVTAFVFRDEAALVVEDIRSRLMPSVALSRIEGEAELRRGWDGHYRADAEVNGATIQLMIDTGASMVLIPYEEAAMIGHDPQSLVFGMPVTTANGRSTVAPIRLASIKIGDVFVTDVEAAVAQPGRLKTGLLGMSFIDKLAETSFQGDKLILRQRGTGSSNGFKTAPVSQ